MHEGSYSLFEEPRVAMCGCICSSEKAMVCSALHTLLGPWELLSLLCHKGQCFAEQTFGNGIKGFRAECPGLGLIERQSLLALLLTPRPSQKLGFEILYEDC